MPLPTYKSGGYGSRPQRPAPRTYQEADEYEASDQFQGQGQRTMADQDSAATRAGGYRSSADQALESFNRGGASNSQGFQPLNLQGYAPTQVAQWQSAAMSAASLNAGRSSAAAGAGGSQNLGQFNSDELRNFDSSDVSDFDPSEFGNTFARGAESEFNTNLQGQLHTLENQGVGAGRLKTGFFTRDQGNVATRLGSDLNSKLAQAATTFSGQRLGALESGAGMRLSRAQGIDSNMLARAGQMDANTLRAGEDSDSYALAQGGQGLDAARLGLEGAEFQDRQMYDRAAALDQSGQRRGEFLDSQNFDRGRVGLDASLGRESMYQSAAEKAADRADSYVSANRGWASQDREAQDQRDVYAQEQAELQRRKGVSYGTPKDRPPKVQKWTPQGWQ